MVAVDILEVPTSKHNNRYLLVIQDYMTKWADAIPIPNQTARRITEELIKVFSRYGIPDILHSDQGRNFESTILSQTLEAFGISKSRTTAYHPASDGLVERFNRSLLQLLVLMSSVTMIGSNIFHWYCMPIEQLFIYPQVCHLLNWCMDAVHTSHLFPQEQHMM